MIFLFFTVVSQINDNTGIEKVVNDKRMTGKIDEASFIDEQSFMKKEDTDEQNNNLRKRTKSVIEVAEVQTQTVNDIGTQTDIYPGRRNLSNRFLEIHENAHGQELSLEDCEIPLLSLGSRDQFEDLDQLEDLSLPSKVRTMSEISLHETTSSIKTETGTEISISTRDVTCSFNKYLDLEVRSCSHHLYIYLYYTYIYLIIYIFYTYIYMNAYFITLKKYIVLFLY